MQKNAFPSHGSRLEPADTCSLNPVCSETLRGRFAISPYNGIALTGLPVLLGVGADAAVSFVAGFAELVRVGVGEAV